MKKSSSRNISSTQLAEPKNRLLIAAAGSGKTTFLVKEALKQKEPVLITTFTIANEAEIRKKIIEVNGFIPPNIAIQTFFSFLLQHGVRPYQGKMYKPDIKGMLLTNEQSGVRFRTARGIPIIYAEDKDLDKHYFSKSGKIYSDKIAKFIIRCDEKSNGSVLNRLCRIYKNIYIDEIQDMAGYDLEIIKKLFSGSSSVLLVGDPRQVTYSTHHDRLNSNYKDGKIEEFILDKCKQVNCYVDKETLNVSHRNNSQVCAFASLFYPQYPASEACTCPQCRAVTTDHEGVFVVNKSDVADYIDKYKPVVLRYSMAGDHEWNFGAAKGLGFERVLIYPTLAMEKYLRDGKLVKTVGGKAKPAFDIAKFYVAVTRARRSATIVSDYKDDEVLIGDIVKYRD